MAIKLAHQQAKTPTDGKDVSTRDYADTAGGAANDLSTTGADVNVSGAAPPAAGEVLTAIDATNASWQAVGASADIAVEVTGADTTPGGLAAKIAAGTSISIGVLNPGANEQLEISSTGAALDVSQQFTKNQHSAVVVLSDGANVAYLASDSNLFELVATALGARQLDNPTGLVKGMTWEVWYTQSVGGSEALTFDTFYDWGAEGAPDFSAQTGSEVNIIACIAVSTTKIRATTLMGAP